TGGFWTEGAIPGTGGFNPGAAGRGGAFAFLSIKASKNPGGGGTVGLGAAGGAPGTPVGGAEGLPVGAPGIPGGTVCLAVAGGTPGTPDNALGTTPGAGGLNPIGATGGRV